MLDKLRQVFAHKDLRKRIIFVVGILVLTRILAHVPVPGIDITQIQTFFEQNQVFGLVNLFSGGGLSNFSIAMMGLGPYITAAIIMQLLTMAVPKFEQLQKEGGEAGRRKISQYTRLMTVPLAALQAFGMIRLLQAQTVGGQTILGQFSLEQWLVTTIVLIAGTMLLMWLGELITENGVGNGISIIIFAGIVAGLPGALSQTMAASLSDAAALKLAGLGAATFVVVYAITYITEGTRNIPVTYARRASGLREGATSIHLPLRVNQAGVIPIIFAISVILLPGIFSEFFKNSPNQALAGVARTVGDIFSTTKPWYWVAYFLLVLGFTYFYTSVTFNPKNVAENIQKQGGFIPGIRPGTETVSYLRYVLNRITLAGGVFLGLVAILPFLTQLAGLADTQTLTIGGTSILIVISVVLETMKQINSQLLMRRYDRYQNL